MRSKLNTEARGKNKTIDLEELLLLADQKKGGTLTDTMEDILISTSSHYVHIGNVIYEAESFLVRMARVELVFCRQNLEAAWDKWLDMGLPKIDHFPVKELIWGE